MRQYMWEILVPASNEKEKFSYDCKMKVDLITDIIPNKDYNGELFRFLKLLNEHKPFALSRNHDGEIYILLDITFDVSNAGLGEWIYDQNNEDHKFFQKKLVESTNYIGDNYYVGVPCKCCVSRKMFNAVRKLVKQDQEHLTFGSIFQASNHPDFVKHYVPIFGEYDVVMVINEQMNPDLLPFRNKVKKIFTVGKNAWMNDYNLVNEMVDYLKTNNLKNYLFLFAAGPLSNILILELYKISQENTYLDIGSALDPLMGHPETRKFFNRPRYKNKICVWI